MDKKIRQLERAGEWERAAWLRAKVPKPLLPDILRSAAIRPCRRLSDRYRMDGTPLDGLVVVEPRRVALSLVKGYRISTVLLTIDHNFSGGAPIIFETMVFGAGWLDNYQDRYTTVEAARLGHNEVVRYVENHKEGRDSPGVEAGEDPTGITNGAQCVGDEDT